MTRRRSESRGDNLADRLNRGRIQAERALRPGARQLPILRGVNPKCQFSQLQENVLAAAGDILVASERVFRYGNSIVLVVNDNGDQTLWSLTTAHSVQPAATALLANLFVCETLGQDLEAAPMQFPPPQRLVELLLNHQPTLDQLPTIRVYATRPLFDEGFCFRSPGWHPDVCYLIHGPEVEPVLPEPSTAAATILERLPPRLRELLRDFCFKTDIDLINAVGVLLTGMLVSLFVRPGKALILVDGNRPSIGKTLLARVTGAILDGADPDVISYTPDDEELAKRLCANLRDKPTSTVLIDNAKTKSGKEISSPVIEANSTAAQIKLRILGQSTNYTRPNDLLWFLTMNLTKASPDIISRGLPIRFHFEGDPKTRDFGRRDALEFAFDHRLEILGELAGLVIHWTQQGQPLGQQSHRLVYWASVIGGILDANGLPGFLANVNDAAVEFSTSLDELAAVAEAAVQTNSPMVTNQGPALPQGMTAGGLDPVFRRAKVFVERLDAAKSVRGKSTILGNFLSQHVGSQVPIENTGRKGTATLRCENGRSNSKLYRFEVVWDEAADPPSNATPANPPLLARSLTHFNTPNGHQADVAPSETDSARPASGPQMAAAGAAGGNNETW